MRLLLIIVFVTGWLYAQKLEIVTGDLIPKPDSVYIYLPQNKKPAKPLPMLILLHGWAGSYKQWGEITDVQQYADKYNIIIATPDGFHDRWYANSQTDTKWKLKDFFLKTLLPELVLRYPIDTTKVGITGLSMGGYGALSLAANNPELFIYAGSTSGILDILPFKGKWNMNAAFGTSDAAYQVHSPIGMLKKFANTKTEIFIDCGVDDFAYAVNTEFYAKAKEMKLNITFSSMPGAHTWQYWKESLPLHIAKFVHIVNN